MPDPGAPTPQQENNFHLTPEQIELLKGQVQPSTPRDMNDSRATAAGAAVGATLLTAGATMIGTNLPAGIALLLAGVAIVYLGWLTNKRLNP